MAFCQSRLQTPRGGSFSRAVHLKPVGTSRGRSKSCPTCRAGPNPGKVQSTSVACQAVAGRERTLEPEAATSKDDSPSTRAQTFTGGLNEREAGNKPVPSDASRIDPQATDSDLIDTSAVAAALDAAFEASPAHSSASALSTQEAHDAQPGVFGLNKAVQAAILLNVSAALFGSNQVVIKLTEASLSANALSSLRFGIAALCFAPAVVNGMRKPELRRAAVELGIWLFGGYTTQALGLVHTTASRGAFTGTFTVLAVPMLVGLSGRKVAPTTWIAGAVALAGVGLLTTSGADPNVGDLLCILSATLFGVHKWRSEIATHRFPNDTNELFGVQLAVLAGASALVSMPDVYGVLANNDAGQVWNMVRSLPWPALVYMGLATTAFTLWVEMTALKEVPATMAALIYTTEPLWGALMAYLVMGDRWGPSGWLGAALIISASLSSQLLGDKTEKAKPE